MNKAQLIEEVAKVTCSKKEAVAGSRCNNCGNRESIEKGW